MKKHSNTMTIGTSGTSGTSGTNFYNHININALWFSFMPRLCQLCQPFLFVCAICANFVSKKDDFTLLNIKRIRGDVPLAPLVPHNY